MMLRCQTLLQDLWCTKRRIASRMSLGNWSPVRSRWRCSKISQAWTVCAGSSIWAAFGGDKICLLSSRLSQLLTGHREQPIFAIVPNLVLIQLLGQFLELLLPSSRPGNVAILGPSHSSHRIHAEGVSQRSATSGSLRPSSPAPALRAPRGRSLSPDTTKFSSSGLSSF